MAETKGVLIVGEIVEGKLAAITTELLGIGRKLADDLGQELAAVLIGSGIGDLANEVISFGADKVYVIDDDIFASYTTDGYTSALEKLNAKADKPIAAQECIVIEDSHWGLDAARAAKMHTLAVTNTYDAQELAAAEKVVSSLSELTIDDLQKLCE